MRQIVLDGRRMQSPEATQIYLKERLAAPGWYGENLDALYDLLTECSERTLLVVIRKSAAEKALGEYATRLWAVLEDAAGENEWLSVVRVSGEVAATANCTRPHRV